MDHLSAYAPCLYFSSADDGTLLEVNDRLCDVLQFHRDELIGKNVEILFTVATRIFQQTHFFPMLKMQGHAEEIFITLRRKNGDHIPVLINAERKLINDNALNMHVGIIVHNRKKFEEELIAARKQAEQALNENVHLVKIKEELQQQAENLDKQIVIANQQNDQLRQFSRVVTHDMEEPLRKLTLFTGMLLDGSDIDVQKLVEKIGKVSSQMHGILAGLQQYVWLSDASLVKTDINLSALVSSVVSILQNQNTNTRIYVTKEIMEDIQGDAAQMELLFYHLLSNSIRFKKNDSAHVNISTHKVQLNQFRNVEGKYKYIDHIRISVSDQGVGFKPQYKVQLFELFKRLHNHSGRGVGLAICKKIVDNHNGIISIDSKENEGTTITILLPVIPGLVHDVSGKESTKS